MAEIQDEISISPIYFKNSLNLLFYLGIDIVPMGSSIIKRFIYAIYSFFMIGLLCVFTLSEFLDIIINYEDINKMTFGLCYNITHLLGAIKMFLMLALRKKLWKHFQTVENGVFKPDINRGGVKEFQLIKNAIKACNRQAYTFYSIVVVIVGARVIATLLTPSDTEIYLHGNETITTTIRILPFKNWIPFDYSGTPYFELVFIFQVYSTFFYGYYIGATDALICGFMMLIKAQFLIVKRELDTLLERVGQTDNPNDTQALQPQIQTQVKRLANECVQHHQELIKFCNAAEDDFCYLMLLQFLSSLFVLCFQLFQLSILTPGSVQFISMLAYLMLITFQLLCYCWHGNEVTIVSGTVSYYAYDINWLITDNPIKKTLLLIMMRSQRPNVFTAGKFSILSLQTFMTILRGAASYFMFLRQMNR